MKQPDKTKRDWYLIDAKNKPLGRISTEAAHRLMGKHKPSYAPYLDLGDNVVIVNAARVLFTGKKENQKIYYHHSQFPGGLKEKTASQIRDQKPEYLIMHAVKGMLPKNKLGKLMIKKLFIFKSGENPYKDKFISNN